MRIIVYTACLFLIVVNSYYAQQPRSSFYFDSFVDSGSEPDLEKLSRFVSDFAGKLKSFPRTTRGIIIFYTGLGEKNINFCSDKKLSAEKTSEYAKRLLVRNYRVANRIILIDGGLKGATELEFWVVPEGSALPSGKPNSFLDCACAFISVSALDEVSLRSGSVTFTVNVTGSGQDSPVGYRWKVSAGRIVSGQKTSSIEVRIPDGKTREITASVKIEGVNRCCPNCLTTGQFTTKIVP